MFMLVPILQENRESIIRQVAHEHECSYCGDVDVGENVDLACDESGVTTLTMTLLSQDTLPGHRYISLILADTTVEAQVCLGRGCFATTAPPTTPATTGRATAPQRHAPVVVPVVVTIVITLFVLVVVLVVTFLIWRTAKGYW